METKGVVKTFKVGDAVKLIRACRYGRVSSYDNYRNDFVQVRVIYIDKYCETVYDYVSVLRCDLKKC